MRAFILAIFTCFCLSAAPAFAEGWRVAAIGGDAPNRAVYLVDSATLRRRGDTVRFWSQTIMEQSTRGGDWDRSVTLREGSCADVSTSVVQNTFYRDGDPIETDTVRQRSIYHQPGTLMAHVVRVACGDDTFETDIVSDPESWARNYFQPGRRGAR